ncbi:MAG: hypothetical protein FWC03_13630, partial [Treponema sp.]|nr:hypothetical protein [Treponema sp.]
MNKTDTQMKLIPTKKQYEEWTRQFYESLPEENLPENSVKKGPYIKALCKLLRCFLPDDKFIELDMGDGGIIEVNGIDIGVHLLCLLKDIPDTAPVIDPRPCEWEPNYNRETWETDLSGIGLEYPDDCKDIQSKEAERIN